METLAAASRPHKIVMTGREALTVEGVEDVISFDEKQVILDTSKGRLVIKGSDLHVKKLSLEKGEVDLDGSVDSMDYITAHHKKDESLLSRLFG